jgi:hypothetical protein
MEDTPTAALQQVLLAISGMFWDLPELTKNQPFLANLTNRFSAAQAVQGIT